MAIRLSGPGRPYDGLVKSTPTGPRWTGETRLVMERLKDPLRWKKPRRIFVNSMGDLFHENTASLDVAAVWHVMRLAPWHTFQILTKRPKRMRRFVEKWGAALPNVWLGVSVEDQAAANERIPHLQMIHAALLFVSLEPLIGPVSLAQAIPCGYYCEEGIGHVDHGPNGNLGHIGWVVCGGESGPRARPMKLGWARAVRDECRDARVAFFMKQLSEADTPDFKKFECFPEDLQVRQFPVL